MNMKSVITGDIINSRNISDKSLFINSLQNILSDISDIYQAENPFEIYRGDSFQSLYTKPIYSLRIALLVRSGLLKESPKNEIWDARISIGLGEVNFQDKNIKISNGEAFERSGIALDQMKNEDRCLSVISGEKSLDKQLQTLNTLADAIISRWSKKSAEVIYLILLKDYTQEKIAEVLGISQSAVQQRLASANFKAINAYIRYFENTLFT